MFRYKLLEKRLNRVESKLAETNKRLDGVLKHNEWLKEMNEMQAHMLKEMSEYVKVCM